MVPPHIIKKIKRIHIKSSRTVNTIMAGQYKSVFRGTGIEFEEVRDYSPGDDVKAIDWKVSARLGKPFIKLYREERESIVVLLIDMSASLQFGSHFDQKLEKAAEIASVLAFNAVRNDDKVGALFFTERVEKYIPPKKGSSHVWRVIKEIFTFSPEGQGTDVSLALEYLSKVSKKKTLTFIISDFMTAPFENNLKTLRQKHEIIGVMVKDPADDRLPEKGLITINDMESGKTVLLDASDTKTRDWYADQSMAWRNRAREYFSRAKSDMVHIGTDESVSDALTRYFKYREKRLR
ncbi:MAG: DUF58 domain-containing protein [Desulfobacteraceae bacterium]|nr:MAG: DUF58 domain-containing protein [Desulfobacteraceae bacterium]